MLQYQLPSVITGSRRECLGYLSTFWFEYLSHIGIDCHKVGDHYDYYSR